ncbi:MAG: hypothetical protein GC192_22125 [Bacteroidetes bacterium]|nr:hypothetical protein [Bacteroidota bacterium]
MNLPNLSAPVVRTSFATAGHEGVMPSVDIGCVISNCGLGAVKCIAAYFAGGLPAALACLGNAAPACIGCFTS